MFYSRLIIILLVISLFVVSVGAYYALEWLSKTARKVLKRLVIYVAQLQAMRKNSKKHNRRCTYNRVSILLKNNL